jgi:hypothetical protein
VEAECALLIAPDIDHPAADDPVAENADSLVIERIPISKRVGLLKDRQFFVQSKALHGKEEQNDIPRPRNKLGALFAQKNSDQTILPEMRF